MKPTNNKRFLCTDVSSSYSESFQQLQVNLDFSFIDESKRVIAITSAIVGEGKSTVTANLAYIYSRKGSKVIVLDLDLRRPTIHRFFGLTNDKGITDYCAKQATKEEIIKHYETIDIITAGTKTPFPGKVLESKSLLNLVSELKEKYDYVLIDTPPMLLTSDPKICSSFVSQYLLVVNYGKTKKTEFDEAINQFKNNENMVMAGVVMTKVKLAKKGYYNYQYQYYNRRDD